MVVGLNLALGKGNIISAVLITQEMNFVRVVEILEESGCSE